jgi:hypothetical protein
MRHIDAFCHFFPRQVFELLSLTKGGTTDVGKRMQGVAAVHDLDVRFRTMDEFEDYTQILSLGLPPLEGMAGPDQTLEFARVANDGLAELCDKYPDRFSGFVGALPMDVPDAAAPCAQAGHPRLCRRENITLRDLDDLRLALRDQRYHGTSHFLRRDDAFSKAEDLDPSHGRDDPVLRRAHRHWLGHAW